MIKWVVFIYVIFSVYLFDAYAKINLKLLKVNDSLLKTCMPSGQDESEKNRY